MNRERAKKLAPIIKGYAEGKVVQYLVNDTWTTIVNPGFSADREYRLKPELREFWINKYKNGVMYVHKDERSAVCSKIEGAVETIRVVEVLK